MSSCGEICATSEHEGEHVDFVDGTVFGPDELYLTLATFTDTAPATTDYTSLDIYYRPIQRRETDRASQWGRRCARPHWLSVALLATASAC